MKFRVKLLHKFVLIMVLLAIGPLTVIGLRLIDINRTALEINIYDHQRYVATTVSNRIDNYLVSLDSRLSLLIATQESNLTIDDRQTILKSFLDTSPDLVNVSIVQPDGADFIKVYNPDLEKEPSFIDHRDEQVFRTAVKTGKRQLSNVYYTSTDPRLNIVYPFLHGRFIYLTISLNRLWKEIQSLPVGVGKTVFTYIVDHQGIVIAHPDKVKQEQHVSLAKLPIVQELLSRTGVGSKEFTDETGTLVIGSYSPLRNAGWGVIVQQHRDEIYHSVSQMRRQAILWIIVFFIIASGLAFYFARTLSRPILAITTSAHKVSQNDFTVQVLIRTHDEVQDLAETFNRMVLRLKEFADVQLDKLVVEKTKTDAIMFSIADCIILTDLTGKIILLNKEAETLFNFNTDRPGEGRNFTELLPDLATEISRGTALPDTIFRRELSLVNVAGNEKFYEISSKRVNTLKGETLGILIVFHDITLEKQLERMKDDFIHSITHDLRNPMTSIRGFLKFLSDGVGGPVTEQQRKMLQVMDRASARLLAMINDILDVAKMEAGKMVIHLELFNLREIILRVVDIQQPLADRKHISLQVQATEQFNLYRVDGDLIERVLVNLVGNAVKFTPEKGTITIGLEENNDDLICWVQDTGEGITPEFQARIFEKFQQASSKQARGGTGLGLTVCKYAVEAHLGKIWVESQIGQGSRFTFTVPKNLTQDVDTGAVYKSTVTSENPTEPVNTPVSI